MNMKDYENEAKKLTEKAEKLQITMKTFKGLRECYDVGKHHWKVDVNESDFISISSVVFTCTRCCASYLLDEENDGLQVYVPNSGSLYGDLAMKNLTDIEFPTPPPKTSKPAEEPTVPVEKNPMANEKGSGSYRVDTSGYFKGE